jgi:hypothetical protein
MVAASVVALAGQQMQSFSQRGNEAVENSKRPRESDSPDGAHEQCPPKDNAVTQTYVSLTPLVQNTNRNHRKKGLGNHVSGGNHHSAAVRTCCWGANRPSARAVET